MEKICLFNFYSIKINLFVFYREHLKEPVRDRSDPFLSTYINYERESIFVGWSIHNDTFILHVF